MRLYDYLEKSKTKAFFSPIEMDFSEKEQLLLEQFSDLDINRANKEVVFTCVLDEIMDNGKESILNNKLLNSLIDQEIALSSLSHMNLKDEYLIKIFNRNKNHYECMLTVYRRNIICDMSYLDFVNLVKNNLDIYSICYTLIDLSNFPLLSTLQVKKILFLVENYITNFSVYPFLKKYVEYYKNVSLFVNNTMNSPTVFCKDDFSKLYEIKNML